MKKLTDWIRTSGKRTFAALLIGACGYLLFSMALMFKADTTTEMNIAIDEVAWLQTAPIFAEVRDLVAVKQSELAALTAREERYNIMNFGGAALIWAGLAMLLSQLTVWAFKTLPGTRIAVVGEDGKLNEKEQADYLRLVQTVYAVIGIALAFLLKDGGLV